MKNKKKLIITIIIIIIIILIGMIIFFGIKNNQEKQKKTPETKTTTPATPTEFTTSEKAIEVVKKIDNSNNYDYVFKEELDDYWVIEKIDVKTGAIVLKYYVGKKNGIINSSSSKEENTNTIENDSR